MKLIRSFLLVLAKVLGLKQLGSHGADLVFSLKARWLMGIPSWHVLQEPEARFKIPGPAVPCAISCDEVFYFSINRTFVYLFVNRRTSLVGGYSRRLPSCSQGVVCPS
jgi:hypothetical protein